IRRDVAAPARALSETRLALTSAACTQLSRLARCITTPAVGGVREEIGARCAASWFASCGGTHALSARPGAATCVASTAVRSASSKIKAGAGAKSPSCRAGYSYGPTSTCVTHLTHTAKVSTTATMLITAACVGTDALAVCFLRQTRVLRRVLVISLVLGTTDQGGEK